MAGSNHFRVDPRWDFPQFLEHLFAHYIGGGVESTGYRLNAMRQWLSMVGRQRAIESLRELERTAGVADLDQVAKSLWMSATSYRRLKRFVATLPADADQSAESAHPPNVFISYKWESGEHVAWVRRLAADLRARGINAVLDQWQVRYGESFTDYMQSHIADADSIIFIITTASVVAAESTDGSGGALKFEVQMMNARRIAEGTRIIGVYRSGDRPPHYLRDHRYADFRDDRMYERSLSDLATDLLGGGGPPPVSAARFGRKRGNG